MLRDDVKLVWDIFRRKMRIRSQLQNLAVWCRQGVWLIEGPYARHYRVSLPESLLDAIRGIRRRRMRREMVERLAPPWFAYLPGGAVQSPPRQCSIAYLSNGGDFKLFDLENREVWIRPLFAIKMERELDNFKRFGAHFNIPAWRMVVVNNETWRCDSFLDGPTLAQCRPNQRIATVKALIQQYAAFARFAAESASPKVTEDAFTTIKNCAPDSVPARIAIRHEEAIHRLGAALKYIPVHGDLSGQNVFVCDGKPWIIDWDTAGRLQPILHDVLYLIIREAELGRPDLLDSYLRGKFDDELGRILEWSDLPAGSCHNLVLLAHNYIVHFHLMRNEGRPDAGAQNVDNLWNPLHGIVGNYL